MAVQLSTRRSQVEVVATAALASLTPDPKVTAAMEGEAGAVAGAAEEVEVAMGAPELLTQHRRAGTTAAAVGVMAAPVLPTRDPRAATMLVEVEGAAMAAVAAAAEAEEEVAEAMVAAALPTQDLSLLLSKLLAPATRPLPAQLLSPTTLQVNPSFYPSI